MSSSLPGPLFCAKFLSSRSLAMSAGRNCSPSACTTCRCACAGIRSSGTRLHYKEPICRSPYEPITTTILHNTTGSSRRTICRVTHVFHHDPGFCSVAASHPHLPMKRPMHLEHDQCICVYMYTYTHIS